MAMASWWICNSLLGRGEAENVRLETDCVRYIEQALPAIVHKWSYFEWKRRATSELQMSVNLKEVQQRFRDYPTQLGTVRMIGHPIGRVEVDDRGGINETIGYYTSTMRCSKGYADVAMRLCKRAGGWKFQAFSIRSAAVPDED